MKMKMMKTKMIIMKSTEKLKIIVIIQKNLEELHIIFAIYVTKYQESHGSTYDYHFITKQLAKEFEGEFDCLGENMEKYITFLVLIKKRCDNGKTISYKLKFINSFRFMPTSLSNLVDNLSEINKKECKTCIDRKNVKSECNFMGIKDN